MHVQSKTLAAMYYLYIHKKKKKGRCIKVRDDEHAENRSEFV